MLKKRILRIGAVAAALLLAVAAPAVAQDDGPRKTEQITGAFELQRMIVTGTRIRNPNLVSSSPVIQVDSEELSNQGTVRVEDALRNLPQVYSTQNASQSNGATGTANLNLRSLGSARTLVLLNGRRMPVGSPLLGSSADINQIPGALIDSVEILTGGASATYGSDAVAGVINFLLTDDFEGFKFDYQFSRYQHDNRSERWQQIVGDAGYETAEGSVADGSISNFSLLLGKNLSDGRGNITAYATYRDIGAVLQANRDYSSCALSNDLTKCVGSATQPQGTFTDYGYFASKGMKSFDYKVEGDRFVPLDGTTFNYGPSNYFQRPDERWTAGLLARYDLTDRAEAYAEFMFMDNRSIAQIAPSGSFFEPDTLSCGNPLLSSQQFNALCGSYGLTEDDSQVVHIGRRNIEGGNRAHDLRHTSLRGVIGLRGEIADNWHYDVHYQHSRVRLENSYLNDFSISRIKRALDAVTDPETGRTVCRSVLDGSDPDCVPWNIFREGAVTQEMIDYLTLSLSSRGTTDQKALSAHIAGSLDDYGIIFPFAESGVSVVVGAEYRRDSLEFDPNEAYRVGDGAGQGGATHPVDGKTEVKEFFAEAGIPLVENMPFAQEIAVDGAYRRSNYDYGARSNTYGLRGGWAVTSGIRLRASLQRAIRAPNVRERFQPQGFNLFIMSADPCGGPVTDGRTTGGRTLEECARSGVTPEQFGNIGHNPANQYNFLQGGNLELEPEESDTYTYGLVWTPGFAEGFTFSLDTYSIRIRKGISTVTPEFILNECLDGNDSQCEKIKRGASGDLWLGSDIERSGHVVSLLDNLAIEEVRGYDLAASYDIDVGDWGGVNLSNILTLTSKWNQQEIEGAPKVDCVGKWGASCGSPTPDVRNNLRVTLFTPYNLSPSLMWRYISGVDDLNSAQIDLGARHYFDLAIVWNYNEHLSIRAGVNNLFDKAPPIAGSGAGPTITGNGNTFPGLYDALGRYGFFRISLGFS